MKHYDDEGEKTTSAERVTLPIPIVFGLFITFAGICAGGFGTSIWWASSISTKMDVLVKQGAEQSASTLANTSRITALELWQRQIDTVGSPHMAERVSEIEKMILQLGEDFRLHKAITQGK